MILARRSLDWIGLNLRKGIVRSKKTCHILQMRGNTPFARTLWPRSHCRKVAMSLNRCGQQFGIAGNSPPVESQAPIKRSLLYDWVERIGLRFRGSDQAGGLSLDVQRKPQPLMAERQRGKDTRKQNSVAGYHRRPNVEGFLLQARSRPSRFASFSELSLRSASALSRSLRARSRTS